MIHKILPSLLLLFLLNLGQSIAQTSKIPFVQNKGQWQNYALFKADISEGQAIATPEGMLIGKFNHQSLVDNSEWGMKIEEKFTGSAYFKAHPTPPTITGHGWRFHFINGNPGMTVESKNESKDFYNFWVGDISQQASNVHSFDEIIYKDVYSNIDVRYYTSASGDLENDIIVKPGSDASALAFEIEGINKIRMGANGELILATTVGDISVPAPVSYLLDALGNKTPINSKFVLANNIISFDIPTYDHSQTLVIDPIVMRWATWATNNSSVDSHNHSFAIDNGGNLYCSGRIGNTGLITVGAFQNSNAGFLDMFIGKYNEPTTAGGSGTRVWQTYLGGNANDNAYVSQIGSDGLLYICGVTYSNLAKTYGTGFTAGSWTQRIAQPAVTGQAAIIKMDLNGNGALVREFGSASTANDYEVSPYDFKFLVTGTNAFDLIVCGGLNHPAGVAGDGDLPIPKTPSGTTYTQPASSAALNGFVFRMSSDFTTVSFINEYGSDLTTPAKEQFAISSLDYAGNIYLGGFTEGASNISYNNPSAQVTRTGNMDGWMMKVSKTGTALWSRYFNSTTTDTTQILSMELTRLGDALLVGGITSGLSPLNISAGCYQSTYGGGAHDLFACQIPLSGATTTWGTYLGGSDDEINLMGLNRDLNNDIYILGYSSSTNFPTISNPVQNTNFGGYDAVFSKLSSTGTTLLYSTYLGGSNNDQDPIGERGIQFSNCRTYLATTMSSNNVPLTSGAITTNKVSAPGVLEACIYSMGNPPDLNNNSVSPTSQAINCGQSPSPITGSTPTYNIPTITRNGTNQTNGTSGAYPNGVPTVTGYQWQKSKDQGFTFVDIPGATSKDYYPAATATDYQKTYYRRTIANDACSRPADPIAEVIVAGTPHINPSVSCVPGQINFMANPTNQSTGATYMWTGPNGYTTTAKDPVISYSPTPGNGDQFSGYYSSQVSEPTGCNDLKVFFYDNVLCLITVPVTLLNFDAVKNNSVSKLSWSTSSENNSKSYIIERSATGTSNWIYLGNVAAAGNSLVKRNYAFTDKAPLLGGNYYRLKMEDIDGKYKYTNIRFLDFSDKANDVNVFPNPANSVLNLQGLTIGNNVKVMNTLGETLSDFSNVTGTQLKIDISSYAAGVYFISTSNGQTIKFVKQ